MWQGKKKRNPLFRKMKLPTNDVCHNTKYRETVASAKLMRHNRLLWYWWIYWWIPLISANINIDPRYQFIPKLVLWLLDLNTLAWIIVNVIKSCNCQNLSSLINVSIICLIYTKAKDCWMLNIKLLYIPDIFLVSLQTSYFNYSSFFTYILKVQNQAKCFPLFPVFVLRYGMHLLISCLKNMHNI